MRSVNLRDDILWPVVMRRGYDPTVDLLKDAAAAYERYINAWVRKCWDVYDWPELSRIESRLPTNHIVPYDNPTYHPPQWSQTAVFNQKDVALDPNDNTKVYFSLQNGNQGNDLTDNDWWQRVSPWDPTLTYHGNDKVADTDNGIVYIAQTTIRPGTVLAESLLNTAAWMPLSNQTQAIAQITPIGKVLKVYKVDPRMQDGPFDIGFKLLDTGVHVGFNHGTSVWLKFMARASRYSLTPWDPTVFYNFGDCAYDMIAGNSYTAVNAGLNHPLTQAGFWILTPFPYVIAEPVWRGVYSDVLREEGQTAKADTEEKNAMRELEGAIQRNLAPRYDVLTTQQTGVPRFQSAVQATAA